MFAWWSELLYLSPNQSLFCPPCISQLVVEKGGIDEALIGANASAEEAAEQTEEATQSGCNIVLTHCLTEVQRSKADFKKDIKVSDLCVQSCLLWG